MAVDSWDAAATSVVNTTQVQPLQINTNPPSFAQFVQTIGAQYDSELHSVEVNLKGQLGDCWSLLGGFRFVELDKRLHADLFTTGPTQAYDIFARNRMYGFQLGAEGQLLCWDRFSMDGWIKAGVFHNGSGHTSALNTTAVVITATDTSDSVSFLGEIGVTGSYVLMDCFSLRASFDLLWLESIAVASDQIPATNFGAMSGINTGGGVFYHGVLVGIELRR